MMVRVGRVRRMRRQRRAWPGRRRLISWLLPEVKLLVWEMGFIPSPSVMTSQSTSSKSPNTRPARSPTPVSSLCNQTLTSSSTTSGSVLRMAASDGALAALCRIASARRFAPGRGEPSAVSSVGGSAMVSVRVNVSGERSLMVSVRRGVGSWVVDLRIVVRGGRREGRRGGILSSVGMLVRSR